jgi:hypothetical protein
MPIRNNKVCNANDFATQTWDAIFFPFKWLWGKIEKFFKKWFKAIKEFFTGKVAGSSASAKMGRIFGNLAQKISKSKVWQKIAGSAGFKFIQKMGPAIMLRALKIRAKTTQMWNVIGWIMLISDIKDATELSFCVYAAFENKGNPLKMPSYCHDNITKAYVTFALEMSGEGTLGNGYFKDDE